MTDALALHRSLLTLDSHIDIPWPEGPPFAPPSDAPVGALAATRRVDLPKMRQGHLAAGCFVAYVPQTHRTREGDEAAFARAEAMLLAIRDMGAAAPARLCTTADAVEAAFAGGQTAIIPAVENGHACGGEPARLRRFAELGARYLTLTHNGHNALGDAAIPRKELGDAEAEHGGLSPLGHEAIAEMNRVGMLVDVSHAARTTMLDAVAASRTPVVATHSCARALCDHPRNLDDAQLDALRDTGGLVQITAMPAFLRAGGRLDTVTQADFADHVDYVVRRIGIEHVGISSDFDGGGAISGWRDASETATITTELAARGYGRDELAKLWGGNFLRLLRIAERAAA